MSLQLSSYLNIKYFVQNITIRVMIVASQKDEKCVNVVASVEDLLKERHYFISQNLVSPETMLRFSYTCDIYCMYSNLSCTSVSV